MPQLLVTAPYVVGAAFSGAAFAVVMLASVMLSATPKTTRTARTRFRHVRFGVVQSLSSITDLLSLRVPTTEPADGETLGHSLGDLIASK